MLTTQANQLASVNLECIKDDDIAMVRQLRQKCYETPEESQQFATSGVISEAFKKLRSIALRKIKKIIYNASTDERSDNSKSLNTFTLVIVQFLSNFATASNQNCQYLFTNIGEKGFQDAIAATVTLRNRKAMGAVFSCIHQCIHPLHEAGRERMAEWVKWRGANCQILLSAVDICHVSTTSSDDPTISSSATDPALEWLKILVLLITKSGYLSEWFLLVANTNLNSMSEVTDNDSTESVRAKDGGEQSTMNMSHEQCILLKFVSDMLQDPLCLKVIPFPKHEENILLESFDCIDTFVMHDFLDNVMANTSTGCRALLKGERDAQNDEAVLCLLMEVASGILSQLPMECAVLRERFAKDNNNMLLLLGEVLGRRAGPSNDVTAFSNTTSLEDDAAGADVCRSTLQLLSQLLYGCPRVQTSVRETGLLFRLLQFSCTNVGKPLRREWALMALRNACAGNLENQQAIESLTLQGVRVVNQTLTSSGLQVDFNPTTGKIDFKHEPKK